MACFNTDYVLTTTKYFMLLPLRLDAVLEYSFKRFQLRNILSWTNWFQLAFKKIKTMSASNVVLLFSALLDWYEDQKTAIL